MADLRTRLACWWYGHEPVDWDRPDERGIVTRRVNKYTCHRCGTVFWQMGGYTGVQIRDDDPRLLRRG